MVSAPKPVTPNVCSYTELTVGMEGKKRPLFITVTAKVTNRPRRSSKWGLRMGRTCGEGWTGQV